MNNEEKVLLLEGLMELDEGTLELDSVLDDYEEWDSLSKLSLMAEAKREFGLHLLPEQIKEFVTVKDICEFLQK